MRSAGNMSTVQKNGRNGKRREDMKGRVTVSENNSQSEEEK